MLLWQNPHSHVLSQKSGGCCNTKGGTNSLLMPIVLEWNVRQVSTYFWPHTVVYVMSINSVVFYLMFISNILSLSGGDV